MITAKIKVRGAKELSLFSDKVSGTDIDSIFYNISKRLRNHRALSDSDPIKNWKTIQVVVVRERIKNVN